MSQNTDATKEQETSYRPDEEFVPENVDADEWFKMASPRVRLFVEDVYQNARGNSPEVEVLKAGDVGVMFRTRYEGGMIGRDFWECVEDHGFFVADVNTGSGKVLVKDRVAERRTE